MQAKKRILFVRPTMGYGGADRVTLQLLQAIDREKYIPSLALMRAEGEFLNDVPADVKIYDCKAKSLWWMVFPLIKLLNSEKFDIIYSTCGGASIPAGLSKILSKTNTILVFSERNILFPPGKNPWKRKLMLLLKKRIYPKAHWITAVSKGVRQEIITLLNIKPEKVIVVDNPLIDKGLTIQKFETVDHHFFDGTVPVILAVGRFEYQKDYGLLLNAFKKVTQKLKARLFILGTGPLLEQFKKYAAKTGIEDAVFFAGFDKNPFKYMAKCDVFVLSSRHEGMPGVLIQALACGAACVSTDCPTGPNELIQDGENGFLVPVGDVEKLAEKILMLLENNALRQKFKDAAPNSIRRFETDTAINSYFNFLS